MSNASQEDLPGRFITTPIQARFVDTDALGHVNNAVLVSYTEIGRVDLFNRVRQRMGNLILARVAIDFERQVKLLDEISVKTRITRFSLRAAGQAAR